jgi:hypothetical protein
MGVTVISRRARTCVYKTGDESFVGDTASVAATERDPAQVTTPYPLTAYAPKNQKRIFHACPHATEVLDFHGWLAAGRVMMKG